jgi:hypothetical protein
MGKEEDFIKRNAGTKSPFNTPEGYFDDLTSKVMENLPEKDVYLQDEEKTSTWIRIKPLLYMVAMFIAILIPIRFIVNGTNKEANDSNLSQAITNITSTLDEEEIVELIEPLNVDNYTLYQYLSEAE